MQPWMCQPRCAGELKGHPPDEEFMTQMLGVTVKDELGANFMHSLASSTASFGHVPNASWLRDAHCGGRGNTESHLT